MGDNGNFMNMCHEPELLHGSDHDSDDILSSGTEYISEEEHISDTTSESHTDGLNTEIESLFYVQCTGMDTLKLRLCVCVEVFGVGQ